MFMIIARMTIMTIIILLEILIPSMFNINDYCQASLDYRCRATNSFTADLL